MFIEIYDEIYALNLNKMTEFIFKSKDEKNIEANQTLTYSPDENGNMSIVHKELSENKINGNPSVDAMRYDLTKILLDVILNTGNTPFEDAITDTNITKMENDMRNMTIGESIAFNTFLNEGFLINAKQN